MLFLKYIIKPNRLTKQCIDSCVICYDILKLVISSLTYLIVLHITQLTNYKYSARM